MTNNLDTLATALHVTIDALLKESPELAPWRPQVGIARRLTDAELVTPGGDAGPARIYLQSAGCATPART